MEIVSFIFNIFPWLLIAGWFLYANKLIFSDNKESYSSKYSTIESIPNVFVTLGLFGTFMGITYGLLQFDTDPDRIKNSIRVLLDGLKTAMFTSIAGISLSLLFGRIISIKVPPPDSSETLQLKRLNAHFDELTESILSAHQKAIISSFERVLHNFNDIFKNFMEDLITRNFDELSRTVGTLTEWQKNHKQDVEELKQAYSSLVNNHKNFAATTAEWVSRLDEIAGQSSRLQGIIDQFNESFNEDGNLSKILTGVKDTLHELKTSIQDIQGIANSVRETGGELRRTGDQFEGWNSHLGTISDNLGAVVDRVSTLRTIDTESVQRMLGSIDKLFETYIRDLEDRINRSQD